jgi:hypothetical protein
MKNLLLNQLSQDDFKRLEPHLKITPFKQHTILFEAEREIDRVYFPTTGVVSLVVTLETGEMVEAAMVGSDGVVGASAALDGRISLSRGIAGRRHRRLQHRWIEIGCIAKSDTAVAANSPRADRICSGATVGGMFCDTPYSGTSLPLAAAGERPGGHRYAKLHARVSRGNARGSTDNCDSRGAHAAVCRPDQVRPRENPDR